jgi:hypothetical protein
LELIKHSIFFIKERRMDFGKAFSYVFQDPNWVRKILITALIAIIPIVGWLYLLGWMVEIARRVINHDPSPLPETDFGGLLVVGFKAFVVGLVYAIPLLLINGIIQVTTFAAAGGSNGDNGSAIGLFAGGVGLCFGLISFIYGLLMSFMILGAFGNLAAKGNIGDGLNFSEVFGLLKKNTGAYLIAFLGYILVGIISSLGLIACFIGVFLTMAYAQSVLGHFVGQAYLEATGPQGAIQPQSTQGY